MADFICFVTRTFLITSVIMVGVTESSSWTIHCPPREKGSSSCSIKVLSDTECMVEESLARQRKEGTRMTMEENTLRISPVFTDPFFTNYLLTAEYSECINETRWRPGVNISWPVDKKVEDQHYFAMITYKEKTEGKGKIKRLQCYNITIPASSKDITSDQSPGVQVVSLVSPELHSFQRTTKLYNLYFHVEAIDYSPRRIMEAAYSIPRDGAGLKGLPLHMRRIVPREMVNVSTLNPRNWVTPMAVYNSSCERSVRVEFELVTQNDDGVDGYEVSIFKIFLDEEGYLDYARVYQRDYILPMDGDGNIGAITFTNLTSGEYVINLEISKKKYERCLTLTKTKGIIPYGRTCFGDHSRGSGCPSVESPKFIINECPTEEEQEQEQEEYFSFGPAVIPIIVCSCLFLLILAVVTTVYFCWFRRRWEISHPSKAIEIDEKLSKKTIFLMYCNDNQHHMEVVLKLADLLQQEGHVEVILDAWTTNIPCGMYDWTLTQINNSNKVILVGSEAAARYLEAHRKNLYWPKLEDSSPLSKMFPLGVKALLQGQSMCPHSNKVKVMLVSFDYSREMRNMMNPLEQLTGSDLHYRLLGDMENLLLAIHDKPRHSPGSWVHQWATDVLKSTAGLKLSAAIKNSTKFKQENPEWFKELYGEPVAFNGEAPPPSEESGTRTEALDNNTELKARWKGPYSIAQESGAPGLPIFTAPGEHAVVMEETADNTKNEEKMKLLADNRLEAVSIQDKDEDDDSSLEMTDSGVSMADAEPSMIQRDLGMTDLEPDMIHNGLGTFVSWEESDLLPARKAFGRGKDNSEKESLFVPMVKKARRNEVQEAFIGQSCNPDRGFFYAPTSLNSLDSLFTHYA